MEEKENIISAEDLMATVSAYYDEYEDIKWCGLDIRIKKTLSFEEMELFVSSVYKACFDKETDEYVPEAKDFAIQWNIVNFYTNIVLPDDTADVYSVIYNSHIIDEIMPHINGAQIDHIISAIDERIRYKTNVAVEAANKQISAMFSAIENLENSMGDIFKDISGEDLKNMISSITDGKIDEEKLVKSIVASKEEV